ncbi:MAG: helix-turn-helix domain-containing protein [Bdellovibrionota bacterium]
MSEIKTTQVYTREEAEQLLRISKSTMMRLIRRKVIRAAKIGGQYRILGAELLRQFHGFELDVNSTREAAGKGGMNNV